MEADSAAPAAGPAVAMPRVSVVTVVRDGAETIADCLRSVRSQTVGAEHVVVDGGSVDGTLEVVAAEGAAVVVSGPDGGIYDAMNRGLSLARGEIVGFLNADDVLARRDALELVSGALCDGNADCCYGDLDYVDRRHPQRVVRRWRAGRYEPGKMYWGWMPPHPTFYARRGLYEEWGGYDVSLGTAADYELMLRFLLRHRARPAYVPETLVRMRTGGASNRTLRGRLRANRMDREAWRKNGLRPRPWTLALKPLRKVGQFLPRLLSGGRTR